MKLTKKTYLAKMNELSERVEAIDAYLSEQSRKADAGELPIPLSDETCAEWNAHHDARTELENEREGLRRDWERRNWTSQDWQQWDLVTSNID